MDDEISKEYSALLYVLAMMVELYNRMEDVNGTLEANSFGFFLYRVLEELEKRYGIGFDGDGPDCDCNDDGLHDLGEEHAERIQLKNLRGVDSRADVAAHSHNDAQ